MRFWRHDGKMRRVEPHCAACVEAHEDGGDVPEGGTLLESVAGAFVPLIRDENGVVWAHPFAPLRAFTAWAELPLRP